MDAKATWKEDLPTVGVSRLRALRTITPDMKTVMVAFPGSSPGTEVTLEIGLAHRQFPNGGSWSFFLCPCCGRRARTLRLLEGQALCRWCDGLYYRCDFVRGLPLGRIEKLKARLYGPPARLKPRPGRTLDRRQETEAALRRALIFERRERLKGFDVSQA
jgi:hypothetical protein